MLAKWVVSDYNESKSEVMMRELLARLRADYPGLRFREGRKFAFRPPRTVTYERFDVEADNVYQKMQMLHEMGHALLKHQRWTTDVERVKMESAAWAKAAELAERYGVEYEAEFAETELDSYRNWLHQRSVCGRCGLTRYQTPDGEYHCPQCEML